MVIMRMEFVARTGRGYVPAEKNRSEDEPVGLIPIDSLFSPVKRVSYEIENTREGQILDYDKLNMTIETDGSVRPEDAVAFAARIMQDKLDVFVNFEEPVAPVVEDKAPELTFNPALLKKVDEIKSNLGASFVLDGGITASNDKFRVTIEMIDIKEDEVIWSSNQEFYLSNLFEAQDRLEFLVRRAIQANLTMGENLSKYIASSFSNSADYKKVLSLRVDNVKNCLLYTSPSPRD